MSAKAQQLTDIGKFYKQVGDFKEKITTILNQLHKEYEIIELNKYYDKLMEFKKVNVRKPIELFYQYGVITYMDDILKRDETIFLGQVSTIVETNVTEPQKIENIDQHDVLFISHIRQFWDDLNPIVKINLWTYIQVISILAEKVVGGTLLTTRREYLKKEGLIE